ncbi:MAG: universal stress protein [Planctomycetaceae bacterium]|nr:universal stress protein [Planctomycetaceae bacterium]
MSFLPRRKILVPVDFSDCSAPAVRVALELASAPSDVHVVHVIPELNPVSPVAVWGEGDVQQRLVDKAKEYLTTWLHSHEYAGVHADIAVGSEATKIVQLAETQEVDLIVIPSHGRTGLTRVVMGSVAEQVTRYATCPTLVLRSR